MCSYPIKVVLMFKRIVSAFQNIQKFEDRSSTARDIFILVQRLRDFRSGPVLRSTFASKSSPDRPFKAKEGTKFWIEKNSKLNFPKCVPNLFYDVYSCPRRLPAASAALRSPLSVAHTACRAARAQRPLPSSVVTVKLSNFFSILLWL